jgi:hypothetical protein
MILTETEWPVRSFLHRAVKKFAGPSEYSPDAVEAAAVDGLAGDQGEPAFDQVEPRGTGRSEVQMEARVGGEPVHDRRMLVGDVVVADQMQLKSRIAFGQRFPGRR